MKSIMLLLLLQLIFYGTSFAESRPSNELPMYGGQDKSHIPPNKINSQNAADLGWEYLMKGDVDTAIKRFNQSWMFNPNNVDALWGFGIVTLQRANILKEEPLFNLKESVKYLEMAKSLAQENLRLNVDLSLSYIFLGKELKAQHSEFNVNFEKAAELLEEAIVIQKDYPMIYANLSVLEFYRGNYKKSKIFFDKATALGFDMQPSFVKLLNEKL